MAPAARCMGRPRPPYPDMVWLAGKPRAYWQAQGLLASLGLAGECQGARGFQGFGVESTDFGGAGDVQGDDQAVTRHAGGNDFGAFRQGCRHGLRHNASLGAEKAVADHDEQCADTQSGGQAGDQHHAADARDHGSLIRGRIGRRVFNKSVFGGVSGGGLGHANLVF